MGLKKRGRLQFLPKGGTVNDCFLRPHGSLINHPMFAEVPLIVLPFYPSFDLIMVARP